MGRGKDMSPILITLSTAAEVSGIDATGNPHKVTPDIQEHDINRAHIPTDKENSKKLPNIIRPRKELMSSS